MKKPPVKPPPAQATSEPDQTALASAQEVLRQELKPQKLTRLEKWKAETGTTEAILVDDLDLLQSVCRKELVIEFVFDAQLYKMACRRLTPTEDAAVEHILNGALPPMKPGQKPGEWVPDFSNVEYVRAKSALELQARAMALYWAVPSFSKKQPGLKDVKEIFPFIQTWFNHEVLNSLYQAVRNGGVTIAELVNFTLPNPSPQS